MADCAPSEPTSPEVADHNGRYYDECREREPSQVAHSAELASEPWEKSHGFVAHVAAA